MISLTSYDEFLQAKRHVGARHGFSPTFLPSALFDFQRQLATWAVSRVTSPTQEFDLANTQEAAS